MSAIRIRPLEPEDIQVINDVHNHPDVVRDILAPPSVSLHERRELIEATPNERYLVAELDGKVVGVGDLRLFRGRRAHAGHVGLAVDPAFWGRGVGSALIEAMIELGERWYGLKRIELKVFADNERAIGLYERFGFEVEATHRCFALRDGSYVDALSMARLAPERDDG